MGPSGLGAPGFSFASETCFSFIDGEGKAWAGSVAFVGERYRLQTGDERNKTRFLKLYFYNLLASD